MKICPKCQKQYPNGFQYCPADTELLLSNDEFARQPKSVVSNKQDDPFLTQTDLYPVTPTSHGDQVQADQARVEQLLEEQLKAEQQRIVRKRETKPTPPMQTEQVTQPLNQPQSGYSTEAFQSAPPQKPKYQAEQSGHTERVDRPDRPDRNDRANTGNGFRTPSAASAASGSGNEYSGSYTSGASSGALSGTPMASSISFSIPEQSSVFSNILSGLKNLGSLFSNRGATGGQGFTFLLTEESLSTRIARVTSNAVTEFSKDPKQFTVSLVKGEGSNLQRRNALIGGLEMGVAGFLTIFFSAMALKVLPKAATQNVKYIILGFVSFLVVCYVIRGLLLFNLANTKKKLFAIPKISLEVLNWTPILAILILIINGAGGYNFYCKVFPDKCIPPPIAKKEELRLISNVEPVDLDKIIKKSPKKAAKADAGGSKAKPKAASGGGGGGRQEQTPPTKGVPPPMSLSPQIIPPNPNPPKITNPTLVVRSTLYGDPKALPPLKGPIGDPTAPPAPGPPSSGPGSGAGIGRGSGTGIGGGDGGGLGSGRGGNTGGGDMGIGGGIYSVREVDARPQILYKEKARFTEEARQNKIQGVVVLNLIFGANGTISNIRVVRALSNGLSESAIAAAQKIRFTPAIKNGKPVSMRMNVEFNFNLY